MLEVENVTVKFGGLAAVQRVSFHVAAREIVAVIGPNGAGKTTLFNVVTGYATPCSGLVRIDGECIASRLSWRRSFTWAWTALGTAALATLAYHLRSLWNDAIVSLYLYQQPFPWSQSINTALSILVPRSRMDVAVPLIAAMLGAGSAALSWARTKVSAERCASLGVARTFQNIRLFSSLSVRDNILIALEQHDTSALSADELLNRVGLRAYSDLPAGSLSYGNQRRLEIARALACHPKIVLLDEPAAGLNPKESADLMTLVRSIRDGGITVVLIEHDMKLVMAVSDRIVVLDRSEKIAEGTPEEIRTNARVIAAYLGGAAA